jgi:hypothetical protein
MHILENRESYHRHVGALAKGGEKRQKRQKKRQKIDKK